MAISINDFRMAIRIDNSEAKTKFAETKEQIASVKAEMEKLAAEGKKDSDVYNELKKKQDALNESLAAQRKVVGLCSLSYSELRKGASELKRNMDKEIPGTDKWKALRADYMLTKRRMKELEGQAQETRFSISKVADGFNRYAAIGTGAVASLTGVVLTARKCVDEYAEMQEAESQVRKYTGMTQEAVAELNEEFKQMDTRTAREKLNALAGDAGRLGITGKEKVLEFVDAADKINVALGEDLGDDAVKNIGKLAQMFGEDDKLGLRGAMLATGSAVNVLGQNSSAAEGYIVGFTARIAGAAYQAKVAQGDIMGYAAVLDQNMQQQEMAATAFQTLMMKMYQEPAKFAKIAGQSVGEFSDLIKTDANEAILQFLETLNKKGGLDQLAPMFKEMGLDGVRASGVISTMAGKIGDIRAAQKLANDAYKDGTSIIDEYNVQNNTVQAGLDKAKKSFKDVRVELGEKMLPLMKHMTTTGSMTVKGLIEMVSIIGEYKGAIAGAMVVVASWIALKKLNIALTKLEVFWNNLSAESFKRLKKSMASNIFGIVLIAIGSYIGKMIEAKSRQDDLNNSLSGMKKVNHETAQSFAEQESKIRSLNSIIIDSGVALNERRKALDELKKIIPGYNALLTDEGNLTNNNKDAIKDYLVLLEKEIKLKAAKQELEELYKNQRTLTTDEKEQSDKYWDIRQNNSLSGYKRDGIPAKVSRLFGTEKEDNALEKLTDTRKELQNIAGQIDEINKEIAQSSIEIDKVHDASSDKGNDENSKDGKCAVCGNKPCTCNKNESGLEKEMKAHEEVFKQTMQSEQNLLKEKYLNEQASQNRYQTALYNSEIKFLLSKKALLEKYGKDTSEIQGQIYDKIIAEANRLQAAIITTDNNRQSDLLGVMDEEYQSDLLRTKQAYLDGDIRTEQEYQERMTELEYNYLEQRKDMLVSFGEDTSDIEKQIADKKLGEKKDEKAKKRDKGLNAIDNSKDIEQQNTILKAMYDADLISYEEYQNLKTKITEDNEDRREKKMMAVLDTIGQAASAASQVVSALQDAETSKVTRKYDKQIAVAKKAGKDTTKLEEEKEEAINQVKKKYADKQFAASVLQVTASTAVAAMESYKAMAGIPVIGPVLGGLAAAAAVVSGAAQIAVAKQQRDEAKGLKSGGYSDEYVDGYTRSGNPDDVAGVIPVHKNEFVANHEGVANPHVRQFLDVFDVAQKNGTIRMINTTQILEQVRTRSGKYSGGYSVETPSSSSFAGNTMGWTPELRSQVAALLQETNRLLVEIRDKELIVDPRKVRDGIKRVEQLERNVFRR